MSEPIEIHAFGQFRVLFNADNRDTPYYVDGNARTPIETFTYADQAIAFARTLGRQDELITAKGIFSDHMDGCQDDAVLASVLAKLIARRSISTMALRETIYAAVDNIPAEDFGSLETMALINAILISGIHAKD